eukprot:CAMPEP_0177715504 /NCGR_PEP_ID=MMETSP0484_2-20121128/14028_1 /TAXON_ID=354590 /ORGANISM="Rhodomonas lens, Strain RHODO" /LENGTH=257 /DNA_ID=CAMNT_0019227505 /DNA_START=377 /DNA_END=1148 /DNA_ORIENTATION=+
MKMELKIHHILSSLLLGTFDFYFVYGCILNSVCFFGTGLPGGLNYLLQFLRKLGAVRDSEANLIYCQLDTWIRMPGLILCISWGHAAWAQGAMKYGTPGWVQVLQIIFVMGNAVYFQAQAVEVYATKKERLKAEGSKGDGDDKEFKAKLPRKWAKQISQLPMLLFLAVCVLMPYITKHPNGTKPGDALPSLFLPKSASSTRFDVPSSCERGLPRCVVVDDQINAQTLRSPSVRIRNRGHGGYPSPQTPLPTPLSAPF